MHHADSTSSDVGTKRTSNSDISTKEGNKEPFLSSVVNISYFNSTKVTLPASAVMLISISSHQVPSTGEQALHPCKITLKLSFVLSMSVVAPSVQCLPENQVTEAVNENTKDFSI